MAGIPSPLRPKKEIAGISAISFLLFPAQHRINAPRNSRDTRRFSGERERGFSQKSRLSQHAAGYLLLWKSSRS